METGVFWVIIDQTKPEIGFPSLTTPSDKATCEFIVKSPMNYKVVSNGLLMEESVINDSTKLTHWKQSVPIATWLYTLGIANFAVQYVDKFEGK